MSLHPFQRRRELALLQQSVEEVLLAAQPNEALSVGEIIKREWGYGPEERRQHYGFYYDVRKVVLRLQGLKLAEPCYRNGQTPRWLATEEARAFQAERDLLAAEVA